MFVFQEPSLLSSLQDNGLTDVMLHALLIKDVSLAYPIPLPSLILYFLPPFLVRFLFLYCVLFNPHVSSVLHV